MSMRKMGLLFAMVSLLAVAPAHADKASLKKNLTSARECMVSMREGKGDVAALKREVAELSKKIDAEADSVPGLRPIWDAYKKVRDEEFIPAYDGTRPGDKEKAKALGTGVQKDRYDKMMQLLQ